MQPRPHDVNRQGSPHTGAATLKKLTVCPGWTRTDMTALATGSDALSDWLTSHVPLGRWATTDEIAGATIFLAPPRWPPT
ncbi:MULTISPECIES: SDR family oxidoreductase [Streptomyces]|uniref:SDR family oxidoreductase n=1 Tax=Streptomyces TaxID=1883 RepID=UPI0027DFBC8F|nr:SDR family oxidoreductase [Streptomyces griseus]